MCVCVCGTVCTCTVCVCVCVCVSVLPYNYYFILRFFGFKFASLAYANLSLIVLFPGPLPAFQCCTLRVVVSVSSSCSWKTNNSCKTQTGLHGNAWLSWHAVPSESCNYYIFVIQSTHFIWHLNSIHTW